MFEDEQNRKVLVYPSCLAEDVAAVKRKQGSAALQSAALLVTFGVKSDLAKPT